MRSNWIARLVARWRRDATATAQPPAAMAGVPARSTTPSSASAEATTAAAQSIVQTVLFIDIGGRRHQLSADLGDGSRRSVLQWLLDSVSGIVTGHGGRLEKIFGDEIMAAFDTPAPALLATQHIHRYAADSAVLQAIHIGFRIGLHHGDAMRDSSDGELFGPAVNGAARAASLAKREQTIATRATVDALAGTPPAYRILGTARFSGADAPVEIVEVPWLTD